MRHIHCNTPVLALCILLVPSLSGAGTDLFQVIREGDSTRLAKLLKSGSVTPDVRDEYGATPLLYAAAYGTVADVELLLNAGADPKVVTKAGSTALLWATGDTAKVRMLLAAGADVNARASTGITPLLSAAFRNNTEAVRILIGAGADLKGEMTLFPKLPLRAGLHHLAYWTNDPSLRSLLRELKIEPPTPQSLVALPGTPALGWPFTLTSFSVRHPGKAGIAEAVESLLHLGASASDEVRQLARTLPPVALAASFSDADAVRMLLEKGVDLNRAGTFGVTPLMIAVSTEEPSLAVVRALVDAGATVNARDKAGRTALDWALMQGESQVSAYLRGKGALKGEYQAPLSPPVSAKPRSARAAIEVSLRVLGKSGQEFHQRANCISCHHQSLPAVGMKLAAAHGVVLDAAAAEHPSRATMQVWNASRESFLAGHCAVPGFLGNITYGLWAMAEEGPQPNPVTDAAAACLGSLQWSDGRWQGADMRPPLGGRLPLVNTALAIRALNVWAPGNRARVEEQIARARAFLLQAGASSDTQGEAFRLLGLVWSDAPAQAVSKQAKALAALQGKDGGWAQRPGMEPDAYATGQAMYALQVGGMAGSSPALKRGVQYLLQTQLEDGTWHVRTRTLGFQPYFESGFPHGRDQFISAAATAWAAIALSGTL